MIVNNITECGPTCARLPEVWIRNRGDSIWKVCRSCAKMFTRGHEYEIVSDDFVICLEVLES